MGSKPPAFDVSAIKTSEVFKKDAKRDEVDARAKREDVRELAGMSADEIIRKVDERPKLWFEKQQSNSKSPMGGVKIAPGLAPLDQAGPAAKAAGRPGHELS
jgi:hypothetical protein